jgi:hypothetical protein
MEKIPVVFIGLIEKCVEMLGTAWGWIITAAFFIADFYGGYGMAFLSLGLAIIVDMILGIWSAVKQGKYAKSELMRDTFSKVVVYGLALLVIIHMEMLTADTTLGTNICASMMCGAEFWSIAGNALIINPNLGFFRLIRSSLVGEIARKLHITEEEVKDAFEKGDKLIGKENNGK